MLAKALYQPRRTKSTAKMLTANVDKKNQPSLCWENVSTSRQRSRKNATIPYLGEIPPAVAKKEKGSFVITLSWFGDSMDIRCFSYKPCSCQQQPHLWYLIHCLKQAGVVSLRKVASTTCAGARARSYKSTKISRLCATQPWRVFARANCGD